MNNVARFVLLCTLLTFLPFRPSFAQTRAGGAILSPSDRHVALTASRLGLRSPRAALIWLRSRPVVGSVLMGRDGATLDVRFRDGDELVLLPRSGRAMRPQAPLPGLRDRVRARDSAPGRAAVLEPFADQLGLGPNAGSAEIDSLKAAGFSVDVLRNTEVTAATMETLSNYSVVYVETHSGTLGDGDAIVLTRQTDTKSVADLFKDGSVAQGLAYGDQSLYVAIKSQFVLKHMGRFPNSSLLYLNGCEVLNANMLWDAFRQQNVATMISWDNKVLNTLDEQAADFMFPRLAQGESVAANVQAAIAANLGTSTFQNAIAHLGFVGDGSNTLDRALHGAPLPTATPTATTVPTATDTATVTPLPLAPSFTFDTLQTFDGARQARSFHAHSTILVKAQYTVRDTTGKVAVRVTRTAFYRRGGAWHALGGAVRQTLRMGSGRHTYRFTFVPGPYHTQRIRISLTVAGQTRQRVANLTVTK